MTTLRRRSWWARFSAALALVIALLAAPALALAGPRSGGSFGGRLGFRSPGGLSMPRSYSGGGSSYYGGGPGIHIFPGFGWGWGGYGGGFGLVGTVLTMVVIGVAVASIARAVRASRGGGAGRYPWSGGYGDDEPDVMPGRAYVYKLQLALGRSARGIQDRLAEFASQGDTTTEAGLAALLQQTALELLREKDSVRYASAEARGPMSLTNAETSMGGLALAERSRFQVERVRAADGRTARSSAPAEEGKEALELVVVTLVAATRSPLTAFKAMDGPEGPDQLRALLAELGAVPPDGLLGIEVIWTPADANDSMTETDVMTTYPELKSL
jgi:uncharacterized membrane protein